VLAAAAFVAGKPDRESQERNGQYIKTWQAAHLSNLEGAVGELDDDASLPASACIAFRDWRALANPERVRGGKWL